MEIESKEKMLQILQQQLDVNIFLHGCVDEGSAILQTDTPQVLLNVFEMCIFVTKVFHECFDGVDLSTNNDDWNTQVF